MVVVYLMSLRLGSCPILPMAAIVAEMHVDVALLHGGQQGSAAIFPSHET